MDRATAMMTQLKELGQKLAGEFPDSACASVAAVKECDRCADVLEKNQEELHVARARLDSVKATMVQTAGILGAMYLQV
ncbi:hypothetical protein SMACR_08980 [Sordaria macrospora]|uniref:WGS project CABT00000000 data, contig 2.31 n=2 Tax=Sordaria macrospora TaxID=5147 RepID=F7W5T6_SORMK|nr:uncharacterized protein SMAC_08980 [Sordaria macrospora k-hell]KAA8635548.1 hypothetical protein SMACR_08980 [Sordaria macrospora]KAH7629494.1 hypothetical protein B0T09DRAFT_358437 [Sordaria sp. MPI-SDFR-AT-0083]WPJ66292.1 hypothetical protein SMAC4_08980 [Sordaria macrospora]CCC12874.1 unnamed protein product [Sordaria macrospora k-hell]